MRKRNATTQFLKECIADALLKLLHDKPLDEITISEITKLANVGRVTFYRHFSSKEDILYFKLTLLIEQWYNTIPIEALTETYHMAVSFFEFVYSIREIVCILCKSNISHIVLFSFYRNLNADTMLTFSDKAEATFMAFGLFGIILEWEKEGFRQSPYELADLIIKILRL